MTLGVAIASWLEPADRLLLVAADTRLSGPSQHSDAGIKTYELGGPCAMVASGSAVVAMTAADLTRSLVEGHNRNTPQRPFNFVTTVKLAGFFLKRARDDKWPACHVVVAGFLEGGAPCLADIVVSAAINRAAFRRATPGSMVTIPVGEDYGSRLMLEAVVAAKRERRKIVPAALSVLRYTAQHQGYFSSIGGGLSAGVCKHGAGQFSWPPIEINGVRYLRGMDVTSAYRSGWPPPEVIPYDEAWCARLDQRIASTPEEPVPQRNVDRLHYVDIDALNPEALFTMSDEPPELTR